MTLDPHPPRPALDLTTLSARLLEHVGRTRRKGGFLSVVALRFTPSSAFDAVSAHVRRRMRGHDLAGHSDDCLLLVLPDTDIREAHRAAERLIGEARTVVPSLVASAGVATGFGEVEGGADALIDAATDALATAAPGGIAFSDAVSGRPRVLVVDDDEVFSQALADTVSELGWEGEPCSDPVDALQRIDEGTYYGLFVDLVLPGTSGVAVLRRFIARSGGRPAILMSGLDSSSAAVLDALSLGPVMFLGKPPSRQDMEAALGLFRKLLPGARR